MDLLPAWPPGPEESEWLDELAHLIERAGAARFLDVRVVRADERDFPEPWQPTRAALERLLARMFWHGYVDVDVVVEDHRAAVREDVGRRLQQSEIEWLALEGGAAVFHLERFGNDDVAGLLSHEVGRAFVSWGARDPYRDVQQEPTARQGSVAAIYLGLGVLAVNSAIRRRGAEEILGNATRWEYDITVRGGLSTYAAAYLLAVQAVVRDGIGDAAETLEERPRTAFHQLVAHLRPHRAELVRRLGLDLDAPRPTLERDVEPVAIADDERPEPDLRLVNAGAPVFRVPVRRSAPYGAVGLFVVGAFLIILGAAGVTSTVYVSVGALAAASIAGGIVGHTRVFYECATCERSIPDGAPTCPGCGGTVRGQVEHRDERLDREEELERERST